jgi:hypothetical protein
VKVGAWETIAKSEMSVDDFDMSSLMPFARSLTKRSEAGTYLLCDVNGDFTSFGVNLFCFFFFPGGPSCTSLFISVNALLHLTTSTEQWAWLRTPEETLPISNFLKPL